LRRRDALIRTIAGLLALPACEPAGAAVSAPKAARRAAPPIELRIATHGDLLEFSTQQLSVPAGARVHLSFRNAAKYVDFVHNWVLIRPGTYDAVLAAAQRAGEEHGWLPAGHPGIIAATPQAHRGQTVSVEFDAPPPGRYLYICTTPGHAASMWGVLTVSTDGSTTRRRKS
jgi:azurin